MSGAFGSIGCRLIWGALSRKIGKRRALPLTRLLLGTTPNGQWSGHTDSDKVAMWRGGRQGTVEMPSLRDLYLEHTIGRIAEGWTRNGWGVRVP